MIPRLCRVPAGEFVMGRQPEQAFTQEAPPRSVFLNEFFIDETPVTCAQYQVFIEWMLQTSDHSSCHPGEPSGKDHRPTILDTDLYYRRDQPITGIDWFDMYAFAAWAGMRLPTEAEWEKAARGTDGRRWPWGNRSGLREGRLQALYADDGYSLDNPRLAGVFDHPEGVSPFGCLDMAGNVWEACQDSYDETWYSCMPRCNPVNLAATDRIVLRGGCWRYNEHDAMCSIRVGLSRRARRQDATVGFRCCSNTPNPCGAIGPMRHLKPEGEKEPPSSDWTTIEHPDGTVYYDGDDLAHPISALYLGNREAATLNDFLILYWAPPPLEWMRRFTKIDTRSALRAPDSFQMWSIDEEAAVDFQAKAADDDRELLQFRLQQLLQPLQNAAQVFRAIDIRPEPLKSLNGYATITSSKTAILGIHAGILRIHERLGRLYMQLSRPADRAAVRKSASMVSSLREYVRSGGSASSLPSLPDVGADVSTPLLGHQLGEFMTIMVLSHELAHIRLGHDNAAPLTTREHHCRELDADRTGLELALHAPKVRGLEADFAMALGFWSAFVAGCEADGESSDTHPSMKDRMKNMRKCLPRSLQKRFDHGAKLMPRG